MSRCTSRSPATQALHAGPAAPAPMPGQPSRNDTDTGLRATDSTRLFTYKVAADGGSAPNPYFGLCTLALCMPRIRRHAEPGDIVVGFGCKSRGDPDEAFRVVYAMQVDEVLPWASYVVRCVAEVRGKVPDLSSPERYAGDCIYRIAGGRVIRAPLPSASGHDAASYRSDVEDGENVLIARTYWYFGGGERHRMVLPGELRELSPRSQGHRSRQNTALIAGFVEWFKDAVARRGLPPGVHGRPKDAVIAPRMCGPAADAGEEPRGRC